MPHRRRSLAFTLVVLTTVVSPMASAQAGRQALRGHVPEAISRSRVAGRVPSGNAMNLAVGLALRNPEELDALIAQISDPASPNYRAFLTPDEFAARFGPTEQDYQALIGFLQSSGLTVTGTHPNRTIVDVSGTVAAVENVLHVNMLEYVHPARGRFFAPDREPSLDFDGPVVAITGLDNFVVPHPMNLTAHPLTQAIPFTTGSGPLGLFNGKDYRAAYAPNVTLTGAGQTVGLFELDGFSASDVAANFTWSGLPAVPTQTVLLDGFSGNPGSANIEVVLDIMMASYMAPGLSKVIVYEGTNWNDVLNRMATDNQASQLSCSWVFSSINATTEQIFKQYIAQGQSFFQASGDAGGFNGGIWPPADNPNVTVVGGTSLTTAGADGPWQSETAWKLSGGGISSTYPTPSYQQNMSMTAARGSMTMRNVPDVAMLADQQIFLIANNDAIYVGGTSAAAPLWAGFMALVNQQSAALGNKPIGFLNPLIYSIGGGSNGPIDLHDITTGSNGFPAISGYDLATGWGTPAGQSLINDLTGAAKQPGFSLSAAPSSVSVKPGASVTTVITVTPANGFTGSVALAASGLPSGVTASFSPSTTAGASTMTLTASASAAPGPATVTVTGTSGSLKSAVAVNLTVVAPNFSLALSFINVSVKQGGSGTTVITVNPANGFTSTVALTASSLPTGVTAAFSPASTTGKSTLTLTASASAAVGGATVTITGKSGTLINAVSLGLAVTAGPNFGVSLAPSALSVKQGASATSAITVTPANGFTGSVALTASGLPSGVTASFSPSITTGTSTLTLTASSTAAVGTATVTVTGTSGSLKSTASLALTVAAPPNFSLAASPATIGLYQSMSASASIAVAPLNGFTGTVTLSASGLPKGVTASFGAPAAGVAALTLTAAATAAAGTSTVTVTGTSAGLSHTATLTLTVLAPATGTVLFNPSSAYNVSGIVTDGSVFSGGGLDGGGRAYSANLVGTSLTAAGAAFYLGPANAPDAISSKTVALPAGQYSSLRLLATAVNGNQTAQQFAVNYSDGTTSVFTQSMSDWFSPQSYAGETAALKMNYRDNSDGSRDSRPFSLYAYSFALAGSKTVSSLTLPANRNVVVLAISFVKALASPTTLVNLSGSFDAKGMTTDGRSFTGGLDGLGNAYSGSLLGSAQSLNATRFSLGPADAPDVVSGGAKTIALPAGNFSTLAMLATGVNGAQLTQTFKVNYTDGTSASFSQSLSDWFTPQKFSGESTVLTMAHRNTSSGAQDNRPFSVYGYTFALNSAKTVASITLPNNANVKILALTELP